MTGITLSIPYHVRTICVTHYTDHSFFMDAPKPKLKLVVRHLPPHLPLQAFLSSIRQWIPPLPESSGSPDSQQVPCVNEYMESEETKPEHPVDWWRYNKGKPSQGWARGEPYWWYSKGKESIESTAYLHFKTPEAAMEFYREYHGHMFVDAKGIESRACVELAPYQKIPKLKKKEDPKLNTIDQGNMAFFAYELNRSWLYCLPGIPWR